MKKLLFLSFLTLAGALFLIRTETANAQTGCVTPPTNTGRVTLSVTVNRGGDFRVWSRMKAANSSNNSYYLMIKDCAKLVGNSSNISSSSWTWVDYVDNNSSNKYTVNLSAGTHTIFLYGNEDGVGVDKILMTQNLTCVPTGTSGDNCPGEVSASPTPGGSDNNPPVISNISASAVTGTTAKINWFLNEYASGQVDYRPQGSNTWQQTGFQTCCQYNYHIQSISGLTNGTTYEYRVKSTDASGNASVSGICTFTTGGASTVACSGTGPTNPPATSTPIPTKAPTSTPIPSPLPTDTVLRFQSIKLHGIGNGGDNTNPNSPGNTSPLRTSRQLSVELIDSSGNSLPIVTGNIAYRSSTTLRDFVGDIVLPASVSTGSYLVKIKSPGYLKKQTVGIITITKGAITNIPAISLTTGDIDNNNALTIADYNVLIDCYSDLLPAEDCADQNKKTSADLSDDGAVNANDYNLFLRELSVVSGD